ncbi:hypothetical protein [Flavobacterium psychrotolerans]|uniref:Uncharacterized protein n=1 Tax=Flavobacterium psychrotolerans TaxID=2169410 RepID=A0A2U1JJS9_9FLAO|nr:hypothetical protein [Flavobacterium psychrotolerans]PWA05416.1 hypothetical protein DB895_07415 [Flavobacterium psychrotolerans]
MKQSEKLDIILKALYGSRFDGRYYSIGAILENLNIEFDPFIELRMLAKRLEDDGLIKTIFSRNDASATLTSIGIDYCEGNSYTYIGKSLITNNYHMNITNSPNANIVSKSSNVTIKITNYGEIKRTIENLRNSISNHEEIDLDKKQEMLECVDEIETNIDAGKKPKYSFTALSHMAGSLSEVGLFVIELGKLIFDK